MRHAPTGEQRVVVPVLLLLVAAALAGVPDATRLLRAARPATSPSTAGPWGRLSYEPVVLFPAISVAAAAAELHRGPLPLTATPDEILRLADVPADVAPQVRALFRRRGSTTMFVDDVRTLTSIDPEARRRLFVAMHRTSTFRVEVDVGFDQRGAAARYWGAAPRPDGVQRAALARIEGGGGAVDLRELLPPFARERLFTYPGGSEIGRDCFWTALNFFNATPDPRFSDPKTIFESLAHEYRPITDEPRFGDLIVLLDRRSNPVHAAVYLADDLVFGKNGAGSWQPWGLMRMSAMIELYAAVYAETDALRPLIVRKTSSM